jgi:hypothetical protein
VRALTDGAHTLSSSLIERNDIEVCIFNSIDELLPLAVFCRVAAMLADVLAGAVDGRGALADDARVAEGGITAARVDGIIVLGSSSHALAAGPLD